MKAFLCSLYVVVIMLSVMVLQAVAADGTGPEPAPWWMRVEEFQGLALKWLTTITIVGGALVATFLALGVKLLAAIKELKERANRASVEKQALQCQVTTLAANMPAPPAPIVLAPPPAIDSRPAGE